MTKTPNYAAMARSSRVAAFMLELGTVVLAVGVLLFISWAVL